jgi:integrase
LITNPIQLVPSISGGNNCGIQKGNKMPTNLDYRTTLNLKKHGRYTDSLVKGLQLLYKPSDTKYWLLRFAFNGKRHELGIGPFPDILPKEARQIAQEARTLIAKGENPLTSRHAQKAQRKASESKKITFRDFAQTCIEDKKSEWSSDKHAAQWAYTLEKFAFPVIGDMALDEIDTDDILKILTPIWKSKTETASRLRGRLEWILAAACTRKLRDGMNPALWRGHLQTILPAPKKMVEVRHHPALAYRALPEFLIHLRNTDGIAALALEFAILNASRTGEVLGGLRSEVDEGIWTISANRMKARKEHRVPLTSRSLEIIAIAKAMDEGSQYLFSRNGKPLSNMAMPMLLRRLNEKITVHGFRSTFRDWVSEETQHSPEVAEMALAHTIKNKVEAAYRRKDLLVRRRILMQDWLDFCNSKQFNNVATLLAA